MPGEVRVPGVAGLARDARVGVGKVRVLQLKLATWRRAGNQRVHDGRRSLAVLATPIPREPRATGMQPPLTRLRMTCVSPVVRRRLIGGDGTHTGVGL